MPLFKCQYTYFFVEGAKIQKEVNTKKMEEKKKFNYQQQYGVIVICKDEAEQIRTYEELKKQGLTLKVVTV